MAQPDAHAQDAWWKILADNWRGRNGNTVTGDSVRNSCADELEKVAAHHTPAENDKAQKICNWLRRQASAENDPAKREAFIEAHNAAVKIKNGEA